MPFVPQENNNMDNYIIMENINYENTEYDNNNNNNDIINLYYDNNNQYINIINYINNNQ